MDPLGAAVLKRWILPVVLFAVVSAVGTYWWESGGRLAYGAWLNRAGGGLFELFGLPADAILPRERFINLVVFAALVVATPGLAAYRRFVGLLAGMVVLVWSHLLLSAVVWMIADGVASFPLPVAVFSDALPFVLWLAVARELVAGWMAAAAPDGAPPA